MKKLMALISSVILCLTFASCSLDSLKGGDSSASESSSAAESSQAESSEESSETESSEESSAAEESAADVVTESTEDADASQAEESVGEDGETTTIQLDSVQEFIDTNKTTFDSAKKQIEGTGLSMDIVARGNSLVYSYTYTSSSVKNNDELKDSLDKSLDTQGDTFKSVYESVKLVVPSAESVIVEYKDSTGELITSKEFK